MPAYGSHDLSIETTSDHPFGPLYNLSQTELEVQRGYIKDNLVSGFIQLSSLSAGALILLVKKKDGRFCLCVDYRGLNLVTLKYYYPLSLISKALDRVLDAQIYIKLNIRSVYNPIRVRSGDEWKTGFRSRYFHFECQVIAFGVVNGPATFQ